MNAGTPGIAVTATGHVIIDKEHRGVSIYARLGRVSQAEAEERLAAEIERVETELIQRSDHQLRFADGAARYLKESANKRSIDVSAWHVRLLIPYIGTLELDRVHDATLQRFIADRLADGVTATTINRTLEVVRTILNRSARAYRNDRGRPFVRAQGRSKSRARITCPHDDRAGILRRMRRVPRARPAAARSQRTDRDGQRRSRPSHGRCHAGRRCPDRS